MSTDAYYLERAINLAAENAQTGGGPFGAIIVFEDGTVVEGVNRVTENCDPTAHAEIQAIRAAGVMRGTNVLTGGTLYSSCEPCPMCLGGFLWSRLDRVIYAADRHDAAWGGFDDAEFYLVLEKGSPAVEHAVEGHLRPFEIWRANTQRVDY